MKTLALNSAALTVAVAGCAPTSTPITQNELEEFFDIQVGVNSAAGYSRNPDMPDAGKVEYTGAIEIYEQNAEFQNVVGVGLFGRVSLSADFAAHTISGDATDFSEGGIDFSEGGIDWTDGVYSGLTVGDAVSGSLALEDGTISGASINGLNVVGALTDSIGDVRDISILTNGGFITVDGGGPDYLVSTGNGDMSIDGNDGKAFTYIFGEAD